ncbi:MAG: ABC transporter ATP-binding protein [Clostridia bacterium]|nr:ABC transporter ATP-binding protein [Clostridia bacterium]
MNAIEVNNLCKVYRDFSLDNISLELPSGCIMGLVGENGAGKSTTLKLILNMIRRDRGTVKLFGKDNRDNFVDIAEDLGVVLDEVGFGEVLNAVQVGKIMSKTFKNWNQKVYEEYLDRFSLPLKKKFKDYSKGMKMKLGIAVALSHDPKLLILDEATSGLDPVVRDEFMDIITEFTRDEGHSVLMSSHIVSDLEKVCDYIAFINNGKLLLCEEKDRLYEKYCIIHCSKETFSELDSSAFLGKKESPYGIEAIADRSMIPSSFEVSPIDIEKLFIFTVRGDLK